MGMWEFYGRRLEVVGESGRREGRFSHQPDTVWVPKCKDELSLNGTGTISFHFDTVYECT